MRGVPRGGRKDSVPSRWAAVHGCLSPDALTSPHAAPSTLRAPGCKSRKLVGGRGAAGCSVGSQLPLCYSCMRHANAKAVRAECSCTFEQHQQKLEGSSGSPCFSDAPQTAGLPVLGQKPGNGLLGLITSQHRHSLSPPPLPTPSFCSCHRAGAVQTLSAEERNAGAKSTETH